LSRMRLRPRSILAIAMMVLGILLAVFSIGFYLFHISSALNLALFGVVGAVLLVVGLLLLITELIETWMSRGQTALVDGLQAG
jgi:zinc transporter ZupT